MSHTFFVSSSTSFHVIHSDFYKSICIAICVSFPVLFYNFEPYVCYFSLFPHNRKSIFLMLFFICVYVDIIRVFLFCQDLFSWSGYHSTSLFHWDNSQYPWYWTCTFWTLAVVIWCWYWNILGQAPNLVEYHMGRPYFQNIHFLCSLALCDLLRKIWTISKQCLLTRFHNAIVF